MHNRQSSVAKEAEEEWEEPRPLNDSKAVENSIMEDEFAELWNEHEESRNFQVQENQSIARG